MAMDFTKVLVRDDVFNTTETIKYGVFKGGQNVTSAIFPSIGSSKSSQTYNIQVPSESTVISRHVLWESDITLKVTYESPFSVLTALKPLLYGGSDALANFPLHQCASVMSATINNNTVSMNTQDILPAVMHLVKRKNLHRYSGTSPTALDSYSEYTSDQYANNNALGGWQNSLDNDWSPRGSWVLKQLSTIQNPTAGLEFVVDDVVPGTDSVVYIKFHVTEPLLMSPFIFGETHSNNQGFYGIKVMNFTFNMNDGSRVWRSANIAGATSVKSQLINLEEGKLNFMFYTPHPSMVTPARNVVGYYEMPRYITTISKALAPRGSDKVISDNIQFSVIPDKLIVMIRKSLSSQTCTDPEFWMTIKNVSIQFNNQVGILSNTSREQLYRMCLEAGSNQSWNEFYGKANITNINQPGGQVVGTSGSLLVLDFAKHIQITEDYFAPGSLGTFQFQISVEYENNTTQTFGTGNNQNLELLIIPMTSGLFVCERGTSSVYSGILTREDVLSASNGEQYSKSDINRMVGGGLLDGLSSLAGYAKGKLPKIVEKIEDKMSGSGKKTEKAKNEIRDNRFY